MWLDTVFFYFFALLTLGGGILTVTRRNAVHSAISLIISLIGVAGLFLLQHAEFLFAVQIVLYVGGIMVLFLFVIMLIAIERNMKERQFNKQWLIGIVAAGALGGLFIAVYTTVTRTASGSKTIFPLGSSSYAEGQNTQGIAALLFSQQAGTYMFAFEIASLLLLVAIIGAVVMAKKRI
jgi:NADH-quinone oxidoreductase subunit J